MHASTHTQTQMKVAGGFPGFMHEQKTFTSGQRKYWPTVEHSRGGGVVVVEERGIHLTKHSPSSKAEVLDVLWFVIHVPEKHLGV